MGGLCTRRIPDKRYLKSYPSDSGSYSEIFSLRCLSTNKATFISNDLVSPEQVKAPIATTANNYLYFTRHKNVKLYPLNDFRLLIQSKKNITRCNNPVSIQSESGKEKDACCLCHSAPPVYKVQWLSCYSYCKSAHLLK